MNGDAMVYTALLLWTFIALWAVWKLATWDH